MSTALPEPFISVADLAKRYGLPASWWYANAESGEVPSYRLGKYRRFRLSEIEAWLETQRQGPRKTCPCQEDDGR